MKKNNKLNKFYSAYYTIGTMNMEFHSNDD